MASPDSGLYGGIFREEIAQQLLTSCVAIVRSCFGELHAQCERKRDGQDVFRSCVDMVRTGWVEDDFQQEMGCASSDFDAQVRGAFIGFVRQTYTDSTGRSTVHVRVTVPPTLTFFRELLRAISLDDDLRSGAYFSTQNRLEQKDVVMQAIRAAMKTLCSEFVYVPDDAATADATADADRVESRDSVSGDDATDVESECGEPDAASRGRAPSDISVNIKNAPETEPSRHHHHAGETARHQGSAPSESGSKESSKASSRSGSVCTSASGESRRTATAPRARSGSGADV